MLRKHTLTIIYTLIIILLTFLTIFVIVKLFPFYKRLLNFILKVLSPFIISALIAYLLHPIVKKIESYRVQKSLAILIIYLLFFASIGLSTYHSIPILNVQLQQLSEQLPDLIHMYEQFIITIYESTSFLPETVHDQIDALLNTIEKVVDNFLNKIMNSITKLFDLIVVITVIPVLTFYFLKDYPDMKKFLKGITPIKYHRRFKIIIQSVNHSLGNYIRGQFIVCLFVGLTSWIALEIIGLNYAALLGIIMGLTNIIPYFGPLIGIVPALAIAVTQSSKYIFLVIVASFIIQMLENNLLSPFIVGKSVNIHPIGIIFALLLGAQLAGIIGMIVAVPVLTILKGILQSIHSLKSIN